MSPYLRIDQDYEYHVQFRRIREPTVEYDSGSMTIVLPKSGKQEDVVQKHADWIWRVHHNVRRAMKVASERVLEDRTQEQLRKLVWNLAEEYAGELGIDFYKIKFKKMNGRWGSCGSDGNLTFNTLLKRLPEELIEYVVFHEVTHRKQMNHGKAFMRLMSEKFPDHGKKDVELFVYMLKVRRIADS